MTTDRFTLNRQLAALESELPRLRAEHPVPADFLMAFAGEADTIQDAAGPGDHEWVAQRLQAMAGAWEGTTLTLGALRCGNCGHEAPTDAWKVLQDFPPSAQFLFAHYRPDVPAGSWVCPECRGVNTNEPLTALGPHPVGEHTVEILLRSKGTEHGPYLYPEAVVKLAGQVVIHAAVDVGQFDYYEAEPALEHALKAAREWTAKLAGGAV